MSTLQLVDIPDSQVSGGATLTTATVGGMARTMRTGAQVLCKNPDGSSSWYTLDAERSTPTVPVLRAV